MAVNVSLEVIDGESFVKVSDMVLYLLACREEIEFDAGKDFMNNIIIALSQAVSGELDDLEGVTNEVDVLS